MAAAPAQPQPPAGPSPRAVDEWWLECWQDGAAPLELRPPAPRADGRAVLRVGRAVQPQEVWERLLPDGAARSTVSREHFELAGGPGERLLLRNLSLGGTYLNGVLVHGEAPLQGGDAVAAGTVPSEYGSRPALVCRVVCGAHPAEAAAHGAAPLPAPPPARQTSRPSAASAVATGSVSPRPAAGAAHPAVGSRAPALRVPPPGTCRLVCTAALGRPAAADLAPLVAAAPAGAAAQGTAAGEAVPILRVGRAVQPLALWQSLVWDGALLNSVSREHFEVAFADGPSVAQLTNLSSAGTLVNGRLVRGSLVLRPGDVAAVPRPPEAGEGPPIVEFQLPADCCDGGGHGARDSDAAQAAAGAEEPPGGAAVVRIQLGALPPPFSLRCLRSRGLPPEALELLAPAERVVEASCAEARLRVGRQEQPVAFWAALLPDPALRNAVSREHFEIAVGEAGELVLRNFSSASTLVNGKAILDMVRVQHGDLITIRASPRDDTAMVTFRLRTTTDEEEEETEAPELPGGEGADHPAAEDTTPASEATVADAGYVILQPPTPVADLLRRGAPRAFADCEPPLRC